MQGKTGPSRGTDIGVAIALLVLDILLVGWLLYGYGITGWADGYSPNREPEAPDVARTAIWILLGGSVVSGGGLLYLRCWVAGVTQFLVLGAGAMLFASMPLTFPSL
ncbi:DUF6234 family protein [Streptomyces sp. NBRC 110611]|uniref:DUF6234 family protein n=1 Tax=Streptomyces sp. NBRC 110611 TaxID=1621259 RepID=UPI000832731E|nr:DUF6234 family protein [Streptomyces sp. NBRC 110611]